MKARLLVAVFAVLALGAMAAGCGSSSSPSSSSSTTGKSAGPIKIGGAVATTGFMTVYDEPGWAAVEMAVDKVNAEGGIDGRQIELTKRNTGSTPAGGGKAAKDLLGNGAEILFVTSNFDMGSPAGIAAQEEGVLNMSMSAASPKYGVQGIGPQAYTGGPATYLEGAVMAQFAKEEGWDNVFLLEDTSLDYSTEICEGFKEKAKELGLEVSGDTFQNEDKSIASQVTQMKGSGAEAIAACTYSPGGASAIRQIRAAGINTPLISDIGQSGTYWLNAVPNLSDFYTTETVSIYGDDPNAEVNEFVKQYTKETGEAPSTGVALSAYASAQLVLKALEETGGSTDGEELSEKLNEMSRTPTLNGPYTFTEDQHINAVNELVMIKYEDGKPSYDKRVKVDGNVNYHLE